MEFLYFYSICIFLLAFGVESYYCINDGDLYRLTSVKDGYAMTVSGTNSLSSANITAEPWQDGSNQKWLTVEATLSSTKFYLLPKRQSWDWSKFVKDGTKEKRDHFPDSTNVMSENMELKLVAQAGYTGKPSQQWKFVDAGKGAYLIKNIESDKCVSNPGEQTKHKSKIDKVKSKLTSLIGKKHKNTHIPGVLELQTCSESDEKQLWRTEMLIH